MNETTDWYSGTEVEPMVVPVEAYISEDYAKAEGRKLWPKVWQIACRIEEIPKVGDYVTYDILDESVIIVRSTNDEISAFHNVCLHRGRRLTQGCGHAKQFHCRFHGWRWGIDGKNAFVLDPEDWKGALTEDNLRLKSVNVDTWGGYVFVNLDPDCEPLKEYLEPAWSKLAPFQLDKMRYRWRQWLYFPCNWKTAIEAFIESYHVDASHPQIVKWGSHRWWSKAQGKHACHGVAGAREGRGGGRGMTSITVPEGYDVRKLLVERQEQTWNQVNATTTETIVNAARQVAGELPEDVSPDEAAMQMMARAMADDAARGIEWPKIAPEYFNEVGMDWHIFPNSAILPSLTCALCYRARPNGYDPNSCIFEVYVLERFPEGEEPKTEWVFEPDPTEEKWRLILSQDFSNMPEVQKGMKSSAFPGARPSPVQEIPVIHFHKTLSDYMGTGVPELLSRS